MIDYKKFTVSVETDVLPPEFTDQRIEFGLPVRLSQSHIASWVYDPAHPGTNGTVELVNDNGNNIVDVRYKLAVPGASPRSPVTVTLLVVVTQKPS